MQEFDRLLEEYRARHRANTARLIAENPGYLAEMRAKTKARLAELMAALEAGK